MTEKQKHGFFDTFRGTFPQLLAAVSGTLFAISDGMTYGWTAPYIPYLLGNDTHIETNVHETEWLETALLLGSFSGLPLTIYLVDKIGRKKSLLLASCVVVLAWIAIAFGDSIWYILVARYFCGMSGNMAFVAAPMYVAEIADQKIRGFLSSIIYIMMLLGCLIVYSVGPFLPFYASSIIGGAVAVLELLTFSFMPESPHYLVKRGKTEKARKALAYFNPNKDPEVKLKAITVALMEQSEQKVNIMDLVTVASNRKAILIMAVLNAGQHMCAYTVIMMNLHTILKDAGTEYLPAEISGIIFAAIMLIAAIVASFQMDKFGRKVLLNFSSVPTGICLLILAVYFHLQSLGYDVISASWMPIVSVMVYAAVLKLGVGIVPIVITAEIFPSKLKSIGMTLADSTFIIGGIVALQLYQWLSDNYGLHVPFYLFAFSAFFITLFTIFYIPETKGKSLDEIQFILRGRRISELKLERRPSYGTANI